MATAASPVTVGMARTTLAHAGDHRRELKSRLRTVKRGVRGRARAVVSEGMLNHHGGRSWGTGPAMSRPSPTHG